MYGPYPSEENRQSIVESRSLYKTTIRKKKYAYDKNQTTKLENARLTNAKLYWKMVKNNTCKDNKQDISSRAFLNYFKSINDSNSRFYQAGEDVLFYQDRY